MKPTTEFCRRCNSFTQHLNGDCSCAELPKPSNRVTRKVEVYKTPKNVINDIMQLQNVYNKIK